MGLGRCLKVTLQTDAAKNYHSCQWRAEQQCQACTDTGSEDPCWNFVVFILQDLGKLPNLTEITLRLTPFVFKKTVRFFTARQFSRSWGIMH